MACLIAVLAIGVAEALGAAEESAVRVSNPYSNVNWAAANVVKANLHTHTTQSDGNQAPSAVIDGYQAQSYDALAITDHNSVTYPWTTYGRDPLVVGMTDIQGNELSSGHHIVSLFSGYASSSADETTLLAGVAAAGGLSFFAHPGRYSQTAQWYADHYLAQPSCIGQEIYNQGDRYTGDRVKWDAVLSLLMPGRPVWGFSNDDSHDASHIGKNRTYLLAPSASHADLRTALEQGAFYATYSTASAHMPPAITNVAVNEVAGTVTVQGTGYTQVRWISQGSQVATGETLDLVSTPGVAKYVRAELHGPEGIAYSSPFGLLPTGNQAPAANAGPDRSVTLPDAATLSGSASDDGLPTPPGALTLEWTTISGPGSVTFANTAAAQTTATFSEAGTYVLRLSASDGALSAYDEMTVTVSAPMTGGWTAYNDCSWASGQLNTRITTYGLNQSGAMVDYATGAALPVTIQIVNNPAAPANANGTGGPMPNSGTDAYNIFNGIVSFANVIWYGNTGWWVDAVVAGLDPNRRYEFATSVNRGDASYTDRWSKFTISGVDAATQASTAGVQVNSDTSVSFWVGNNSANGHVARWTEVRPGSDGSFTVRAEADGQSGHNTQKAYAFDGILLRDLGPATPGNQAPSVSAGADQTITLPAGATLSGTASDDGLPNPPAALTLLWEEVSGPGTVTFANAAAAQTTATFSEAGAYVLRLTATDSTLSAADELTVTVNAASLSGIQVGPAGSGVQVFDTLPPASELATSFIGTGKDGFTTAAGLDAGVTALNQSAVIETLIGDTSASPAKRNRAVWTSGGSKFVQISSTSVGAVLLKATLVNNSGDALSSLRVAYDYTVSGTQPEEVPGLRAFYSLTGAAGSWVLIPQFSGLMASQALDATLTFGTPWQPGAQMFLMWADDNSAADDERKYQIDNFSAAPASLPLSVALTQPADGATFAKNQDVTVAATLANGTAPYTVRFFAAVDGGAPAQVGADVTAAPYQLNLGPLTPASYVFHAEASDAASGTAVSASNAITVANLLAPVTQTLIPAGAVWKYLDDGSDRGTAWRAPAFGDSAWAQGPAPLGYGDSWIVTTVYSPPADNRYITTYFRKTIQIERPTLFSEVNLRCRRDDGVVVYVNGVEVWRSNMPEGEINYLTCSSTIVSGADETTWFEGTVPPALLVPGDNPSSSVSSAKRLILMSRVSPGC
jgi:hypothetical protein